MSSKQSQEEILKRNLEFVYGKNKDVAKFDLDKHTVVRSRRDEPVSPPIEKFAGEHAFLAPDYECQVCLGDDFGAPYPSYEHALMASKLARHPNKTQLCEELRKIKAIREVKQLVNKQTNKDIQWWKDSCSNIAEVLLRDKFFRSKELRSKLTATEDRPLVFGNDHNEMLWGVHLPTGKGDNLLGKLLMKIRDEISKGDDLVNWVKHSIIGSADVHGVTSIDVLVEENDKLIEDECKVIKRAGKSIYMAVIGKHAQNDVVIKHDSVNSSHAIVVVVPQSIGIACGAEGLASYSLVLIDLESRNKSKINGKAIQPYRPRAIAKDSLLSFGACGKRYRFNCAANETSSSASGITKEDIYDIIVSSDAVEDILDKSRKDNTVYIGNIPYDMTERTLRDMFRNCGPLAQDGLEFPIDRATRRPRGFALMTFGDSSGVTKALFRDGDDVDGRKLRVKRYEPNPGTSGGKRPADGPAYGLHKRQAR